MACAALVVAVCVSSCATRPPNPEPTVDLRLLSWNILHGADADGRLNLDEKARFLTKDPADIVFLQEVDRECERSGRIDQMDALARATGMTPAFGAFMKFQGGEYGMGMLSRLEVARHRAFRLPDGNEPRVALMQEVTVLGETLLAVDVHLNWIRDDTARFAQASALVDELAKREVAVIVAGDFNDVPDTRTLKLFYDAGFRHVDAPGPSFSAQNPRVDIDHLLIRSGGKLRIDALGGGVLDERTLSDHRPVEGRIRLTRVFGTNR